MLVRFDPAAPHEGAWGIMVLRPRDYLEVHGGGGPTLYYADGVRAVSDPAQIPALLTAPSSALWLATAARGDSGPSRRVPHCGYDLRATRERCPECDDVPAPPAAPERKAAT